MSLTAFILSGGLVALSLAKGKKSDKAESKKAAYNVWPPAAITWSLDIPNTMKPRLALVTGGNKGIGLACVTGLAKLGHRVIFTCRNEKEGEKLLKELNQQGHDVMFFPLDARDNSSVDRLIQFVKTVGSLDILINNAGVAVAAGLDDATAFDQSISDVKPAEILDVMQVNTFVPLRLLQAFIPEMKKKGYGRIVNMSSGAGQLSEMNGLRLPYRMSKASLNCVTRVFQDELKDVDVLVNSMCPGLVRTDLVKSVQARFPNLKFKTPEEGADTALWLATLPKGGPRGGFFRNRAPLSF